MPQLVVRSIACQSLCLHYFLTNFHCRRTHPSSQGQINFNKSYVYLAFVTNFSQVRWWCTAGCKHSWQLGLSVLCTVQRISFPMQESNHSCCWQTEQ
jgi:hypothetical protein